MNKDFSFEDNNRRITFSDFIFEPTIAAIYKMVATREVQRKEAGEKGGLDKER